MLNYRRMRHIVMLALSVTCFTIVISSAPGCGSKASPKTSGRTQLVLLGTGTPNAEPDRSGPAVAVVVDDVPYVVDSGPGVVRRASAAAKSGIDGLEVSRLKRLFVTHLHSDHTAGYPDFILTPWVLERDGPLEVYGPPGIREMTENILEAYKEDILVRLEGLEPANDIGYRVNVHEIESTSLPYIVYSDSLVRVTAFPVNHGDWAHAFGYRFDTPDRIIVISGDTVPVESIVEQSRGCDILVHEVYSQAGFERRTPVWQRYHSSSHTSSVELAGIAARARPRLLVLYHQLLWGSTPRELLAEIAEIYEGDVAYGNDLDVY